jgi:hypothetical protein
VASTFHCVAPAELGDDCDDLFADAEFFSCGPGLLCRDDECVAQLDPGADCESEDTPGTADSAICKNEACVENWDENGFDFICSDAAIPESNGGDNLICSE